MNELKQALTELEEETVLNIVQARMAAGDDPKEIFATCQAGMKQVGQLYERGEYFLPELMMAGEIFKQVTKLLESQITIESVPVRGKIVFGTVENDIHDIGKDLVVGMLRSAGFEVIDLGIDVPAQKFVEAVQESGARIVGLSGLLTLAFDSMKETVEALETAGLRPGVKVMIGGGSINEKVLAFAGADAYGPDPQAAVNFANQWIAEMEMQNG